MPNEPIGNRELVRQIKAEMAQSDLRITRLEAEKRLLENSIPKSLPKVKRNGFFGIGSYKCRNCGNQTRSYGRWTCQICHHQQLNQW